MTNHPLKTICSVLGVSRATAYRQTKPRPRFYRRAEDDLMLEQIRTVTRKRATYGHRRVGARVNRLFGVHYNRKRIRRVMRLHDLQIPPKSRRRTGRAHTGKIETEQSNVRWSSDAFEIACWNGGIVQIGFALDCCDREALAFVAERVARAWSGQADTVHREVATTVWAALHGLSLLGIDGTLQHKFLAPRHFIGSACTTIIGMVSDPSA